MTTHNFTYKGLLMLGWEKTKLHFWFLLGVAFIYIVLMGVTSHLPVIGNIVSMVLTIATLSVALVIVAGHTPKYEDMLKPFKTYKAFWHYLLATIVYMLIVVAGLILLILPGIYLAVRLQFYSYLVVDHENMGPIEALKKSMEMTDHKFWKLFGWGIVMVLVNLVGVLALGVGLLFTIPTTMLAYTFLYKKLAGDGVTHEHHTHHEGGHLATA